MVEPAQAGPVGRSSRGAAAVLAFAVLALGVVGPLTIFALPLGVLLLALPRRRWERGIGVAVLVWALWFAPGGDSFESVARGWSLLLGGGLVAFTVWRPGWSVFSRAFAAVVAAAAVAGVALAATGSWGAVDATMAANFQRIAPLLGAELDIRFPGAEWVPDVTVGLERTMDLWAQLFPGMLALQSLAALALVSWVFGRVWGGAPPARPIGLLREFRFDDALVWVLVVGLALIALPLGGEVARLGYNLLLMMGALYAVRGLAVFVYLARGGYSVFSVVIGTLAVVLFFQIALTAAVLVGLGDTWLDVRGRAAAASRA